MSQNLLACCLIIAQVTTLITAARQVDEEGKRVSCSRSWKPKIYLNWLRSQSRRHQRHYALSTKDAEYYFYQQETYRKCLIRQLQMGIKSSITYFNKVYTTEKEMVNSEPFCDVPNNTSELRIRCQEVIENNEFHKHVFVLYGYTTDDDPECIAMSVDLKNGEHHELMMRRKVVKCPTMILHREDENYQQFSSNLYIVSGDDPTFNGSLVYVFVLRQGVEFKQSFLKVITLLINWRLMDAD